tara:strand:- start:1336 stop:2364 length:1029 start_codon:yes stop_codon:yes gene_type:complete
MNKICYINSTASISSQNTFRNKNFFEEIQLNSDKTTKALEPNYNEIIKKISIRRMSKITKMGIATAQSALEKAEILIPDAIITGTGMGCLENSEKFLKSVIESNEEFLSPTAFIQSTHNTVGAQIALNLKCNNYNMTFVHGSISFELALIDAQLMILENKAENVLVGGIDELGKKIVDDTLRLENKYKNGIGVPLSEGSNFFVISSNKTNNSLAILRRVEVYHKIHENEIVNKISLFLKKIDIIKVDAIILGLNGDVWDKYYKILTNSLFNKTPQIQYKNVSGEFSTSSSFGLWLGTEIINKQHIPRELYLNNLEYNEINTILLVNQFKGTQFSFTLIEAVD